MNLERECEEHLSWLWEAHKKQPLRKLRKFANSPDTAMQDLYRRVEESFQARRNEVGEEGVLSDLTLDWVPAEALQVALQGMPASIASERVTLDEDEVDRKLVVLFERAMQGVSYGPIFLGPPPCRQGQQTMHIAARLTELQSLREERRARAALDLYADAFEALYVPWVLRLWILSDLAAGVPSSAPGTIGSLVGQLRGRGVDTALLVENAVHIRNAATHDGCRYDAGSKRLRLQDQKWSGDMSARDIELLVARVLDLQESLRKVNCWFFPHAMYESGLSAATVELLLARRNSSDLVVTAQHSAYVKTKEATLFEPAQQFVLSTPEYRVLTWLRAREKPLFAYCERSDKFSGGLSLGANGAGT